MNQVNITQSSKIYIYSGRYFELRQAIEAIGKLYNNMGEMKGAMPDRPDTDYDPIRAQIDGEWKEVENALNKAFIPSENE